MITVLLFATLALFSPASTEQPEHACLAALHTEDCYEFTVDNVTSDSIGDVSVNGASASAYINVTGNGFFEQDVCFTAVSVTIQGNVVSYPNSAEFQLADGTKVQAGWQSPSLVEVENERQQGGPDR